MLFLEDYFNIFTKYQGLKSKNGQKKKVNRPIHNFFTENGKIPLAFSGVYDMIV